MNDLPIACSLTSPELHERRRLVLEKIRRGVLEIKELEDGYVYSFPSQGDWLRELAGLIDLERQCVVHFSDSNSSWKLIAVRCGWS